MAADIAEATLASAPAPELAALLQNLTAAAPAPAPSPAALSPLPLTAPAAAALRSFQAAAGGSSSGNATEQPLLALPARQAPDCNRETAHHAIRADVMGEIDTRCTAAGTGRT